MTKSKHVIKKIIIVTVSALSLFIMLYYYIQSLPFGLELTKIDLKYYIHDKGGRTILAEGYNVGDEPSYPKIEKILKYSKNKLGLSIIIKSKDERIWYVVIKPKPNQNFLPELIVNYTILSPNEYDRLNTIDFWIKIR